MAKNNVLGKLASQGYSLKRTKEKTRVFICGLGNIGCGYDLDLESSGVVLTHAKAFSQVEDFELVGGADPCAINRLRFSHRYGRPSFSDLTKGLEEQKPSLVVLASPTECHLEGVEATVRYESVRYILCEKPLAWTFGEGNKILDLCEKAGVRIFVNYMRRSNPVNLRIKHRFFLNQKWIKGFGTYTKGLLHNGSHLLNLLEFWFGAPESLIPLNQGRPFGKYDRERDFHIRFLDTSFTFHSKFAEDHEDNSLQIHIPEGILDYCQGGRVITWRQLNRNAGIDPKNESETEEIEKIPSGQEVSQLFVARNLADELQGVSTTLCTGKQALDTLILSSQILEGYSLCR